MYPSKSRFNISAIVLSYCCTTVFLVITVALVEQDTELSQLRQAIDQLRQEKAKETERADKLAEELKGEFLLVGITVEIASLYDGTL